MSRTITLGILLALAFLTSSANALNFTWTGEINNNWHVTNNWAPLEFGPPGNLDTATISNGRTVLIDANFVSSDFIDGLTITSGELRTHGFEAIVDNGVVGSTALTLVSGANSRLQVELNTAGVAADSFDTDLLTVTNGGQANLYGGRLEVDSGLLNVGSTGRVQGYGAIDLEASVSATTTLLRNDGLLRVGIVDVGPLMPRTLAINVFDADGRIDLDGGSGFGQVVIGLQATLDVNGQLAHSFGSEMTFAPDSHLQMSHAWTADDFSTINVDARSSVSGVPSLATIEGGTMTHNGLLNVHSGTLFVDSDFEGYLGTIEVGGQGQAATICLRGHAVVGAVHLNGTQAAPAKICGDDIEFRPDSFTLVTGYAIGEGDFLPWQNNFGAGSQLWIDGSSFPSTFEIHGNVAMASDLQLDGAATLAIDEININGAVTVNDGLATIAGNVLLDRATLNVAAGSELRFRDSNEWRNMNVDVAGNIRSDGRMTFNGSSNLRVELLDVTSDWTIAGDTTVTANQIDLTNIAPLTLTVNPNASITFNANAFNSWNDWCLELGATAVINTPSPWTAEGDILLEGGGATIGGQSFTSRGRVSGSGNIELLNTGWWYTNDGEVSPGFSPGVIQVNGNYQQTAAGELHIELDGLAPGTEYDVLSIAGAATLDGDLTVDLIHGFSPALGDTFEFLTATGGVSGVFASEILPDLGSLLDLRVVYGTNAVTLVVVAGCDFNSDSACDIDDLNAMLAEGPIAPGVPVTPGVNGQFDLTGDGLIDNADADQWLADAASINGYGSPYQRGDANLDGRVDGSDFGLWNANKFTSTLFWDCGNFDGNAVADGSDFGIWNANKFTSSDGASAVPEPVTSAWVFVGAILWGMGRQCRKT